MLLAGFCSARSGWGHDGEWAERYSSAAAARDYVYARDRIAPAALLGEAQFLSVCYVSNYSSVQSVAVQLSMNIRRVFAHQDSCGLVVRECQLRIM